MALHKLCGGRFQFDRLHHNFDATMFILPKFSDGILSTWTFLVEFRWMNQMRCWILGVKKMRRLPIVPQKITLTLNRNSSGSRKNAIFFAQEKFLLTGPLNSQDLRKKKDMQWKLATESEFKEKMLQKPAAKNEGNNQLQSRNDSISKRAQPLFLKLRSGFLAQWYWRKMLIKCFQCLLKYCKKYLYFWKWRISRLWLLF